MAEPAVAAHTGIPDRWYFVVQTKPWSEAYALDFLINVRPYSAARFEVYYPRVQVGIRHAGRFELAARPFLSRTMFVLDDGRGTEQLRCAPGVASLIRVGGSVARVTQRVVDGIRSRERDGYVVLEHDEPVVQEFRRNELVQVRRTVAGRDRHFEAVFHRKTGKDRAVVFMQWMGSTRRSEVDIRDVMRA